MHLFLIAFLLGYKCVLLSESSCQMVKETIKYVSTCPQNKSEWFLAAENKNCSQHSNGCKEELVYHCVPNHYENATLEVCAPVTLIVFGHCVEYSFLGKRVQANHNTECKTCPIFYKSNEAYKYKECYTISETTTTTTTTIHFSVTIIEKEITKHFEENVTIPWNIHEMDGEGSDKGASVSLFLIVVIPVIIVCLVVILSTFAIYQHLQKSRKVSHKDDKKRKPLLDEESQSSIDEESQPLLDKSTISLQEADVVDEVRDSPDAHPEENMNKERNMESTKALTMTHSLLREGFDEEIEEKGIKNERGIENMKVTISPSEHETILKDIRNITFVNDLSLQDAKRFKMRTLLMGIIKIYSKNEKAQILLHLILRYLKTKVLTSTVVLKQYYSNFVIFNILALEHRSDTLNKQVIIFRHDLSYKLLRTLFKASTIIHKLLHLMSEYTKYKSYGLKQKLKTEIETPWNGLYPIHIVSLFHNVPAIELLLEHGANVNVRNDKGWTALLLAVAFDIREHYEMRYGYGGLCREKTIYTLLKHNADVNLCTVYTRSPLCLAIKNDFDTIAQLLVKHGADIHRTDNKGRYPIHIACINGNLNTVELLLEHQCNVNARDNKKESSLIKACRGGFTDIVKTLIQNNADINLCNHHIVSPLSIACMNGHYKIVELLINNNADVNLCDKNNTSPLLFACFHVNIRPTYVHYKNTVRIFRSSYYLNNIVQLLLSNHANINCRNNHGISPLHAACLNDREDTVKLLLGNATSKWRILVDKNDRMGRSPTHLVSEKGQENILRLLLPNQANVNIQDADGNTPLLQASKRNNYDLSCLLLENGADLHLCDRDGNTPLLHAFYNGNEKMVELFLHRGADVDSSN